MSVHYIIINVLLFPLVHNFNTLKTYKIVQNTPTCFDNSVIIREQLIASLKSPFILLFILCDHYVMVMWQHVCK